MLQKVVQIIGNGIDSSFILNHGIEDRHVIVQVSQNREPYQVICADIHLDPAAVGGSVKISFSLPPQQDEFVVVVIG